MNNILRYIGQVAVYLLIAVLLGSFADSPIYVAFPPDKAKIVLSFAHGGAHKGECRRLTAEELAELAPNMRRPTVCPRERLPVSIEVLLDGEVLISDSLAPTGLSGDGPSQMHRSFVVDPGTHQITARLRDSARAEGFDYERDVTLDLDERQSLVIDFRADKGGFLFL